MNKVVCGYAVDECSDEAGEVVSVICGIQADCVDVGRDEDGEMRGFVTTAPRQESQPPTPAPSRLFHMLTMEAMPIESGAILKSRIQEQPSNLARLFGATESLIKQGFYTLLSRGRRKYVMVAAGGAFVVVVFVLSTVPHVGADSPAAVSASIPAMTAQTSGGVTGAHGQQDQSDPLNAGIELALSGAITSLGSMQGVSRDAVHASIASRAGEIVLLDISVTKPGGLTAFATVLLQKVGSQWRMRQIVDERN